ncbi:hypothetical protein PENTCL1PPCAC_13464 [Pristionchus entomophagus]|uniref:Adenosine kinase n=1 Tax=Pristionchus entomophagus TaxID=358040 RepID=A0AAV5TC26_9BILA|nr:hypothetical protein PENTCL1PPCAC_13464 [Pristionchus entomophagus]
MASSLPDGILLGICNPLLDLQAHVEKKFLDKWGLKENDAIMCDDERIDMFDELINNYKVNYIPGGATLNALRVCQWMLNEPNKTIYFGAIGDDTYGTMISQKSIEAGVNVQFQVSEGIKTGTCAALINGIHRSLCSHLAASTTFKIDHILQENNWELVKKAQYCYYSGFFLTVCPDAAAAVSRELCERNRPVLLNLAAPFISQCFWEPLTSAIYYADYVFGNEDEAVAYAKAAGLYTNDLTEIAKYMAGTDKANDRRQRVVILTRGADPVLVVSQDSVREVPVDRLPKDKIVDTNAAGDAFVGGFLSQLVQGKGDIECVKAGNYAASEIIQQHGCTFPSYCNFH